MRRILSLPVDSPTLDEARAAGGAHAENQAAASPDGLKFPERWKNADVQGILYARQGWVCAYCGSKLAYNDPGDVEHFRPKGRVVQARPAEDLRPGYWFKAYDLDNFVFSCRVCNSSRKGDRFPVQDEEARRQAWPLDESADLSTEDRILLHPVVDDVEEWLTVDILDDLCRVVPAPGCPDEARAEQVIAFFDLNATQLLDERLELLDEVLEELDEGKVDKVKRRASRFVPHSQVALRSLEGAGHQGPEATAELQTHVGRLVASLVRAMNRWEAETETKARKRRRTDVEERAWALAALWESHAWVGSVLDVEGLKDFVQSYLGQLAPVGSGSSP